MIQLTPLDQTVAGQELIQMGMERGLERGLERGIERGIEKGVEKGELIGKIRMAQRFLKRRLTPKKRLLQKNADELRATLKKLESALSI